MFMETKFAFHSYIDLKATELVHKAKACFLKIKKNVRITFI